MYVNMSQELATAALPGILAARAITDADSHGCGEPAAREQVRRRFRGWLAALCALATLLVTASANAGYWDGVARALPVSPTGHVMAVSFHNCYDAKGSLAETNTKISRALARDFDLVELDVTFHGSDHRTHVEHDEDDNVTQPLSAVLANPSLRASNRMLFIEVKEEFGDEVSSSSMMFEVLRLARDLGYARPDRPLVLRAFFRPDSESPHQHLAMARKLLALQEFAGIRNSVRYHTLIKGGNVADRIHLAAALGIDGVEVEWRQHNLFGELMRARALGMAIGVFTAAADLGEVFIAAFREDLDFITTDYYTEARTPSTSPRALIQAQTALLHMNTASQIGFPVPYTRANSTRYLVPQLADSPGFEFVQQSANEDRVGGRLVFDRARQVTTYDADNNPSEGYLVTAVVNFDAGNPDSTRSIVAKSENSGFALEQVGYDLRFGVFVNGSYRYAWYRNGAAPPSTTQSFFIIGAYDGSGKVQIWVNNDQGLASADYVGGVTTNNLPIVIGADPQANETRRDFFQGKIQQMMVQRWGNH